MDILSEDAEPEEVLARIHSALSIKEYKDEIQAHAQHMEQVVRERTAELELAQAELIWRLGRAGEYRDQETGNHVIRVGLFSQCLAVNMGLDAGFAHKLFLTSPLHDLGKIGIPDSILLKPGKLDEQEWKTMQGHAAIGAEILRDEIVSREHVARLGLANLGVGVLAHNPFREMAAQIAEAHHERWDGGGYPAGLSGEDIPLAARITTVADVYDALCSRRPYKEAYEESEALAIMRRGNGTQFDPNVFSAFEESLEEFRAIRAEFDDAEEMPTPADLVPSLVDLRRVS
jgi:putative two-component system response regulator